MFMNVKQWHVLMTYYWAIIIGTTQSLTVKLFLYFLHIITAHVKQEIDLYSHVNINDTSSTALQLSNDLRGNWLQS